jgi:hypothetical protein
VKIEKRSLTFLESAYSISAGSFDEQTVVFVGSEGRGGETLMFRGPEWKLSKVAKGPGGNMGIIPMPSDSGIPTSLLIIDGFFPIFQSEGAGASLYSAGPDITQLWERRRVFDLPFLHRIDLVFPNGNPTVIAAALCGEKAFQDDWSSPGAVYAVKVEEESSHWDLGEPILGGISKNHGMFVQRKKETERVFISGEEGILTIEVPHGNEDWRSEKIMDIPTGDVVVSDLDGDGGEELVTIQPFHGDSACIYKQVGGAWQPVWQQSLKFGHVAWAGKIRGRECIILGSRDGKKELSLHVMRDPSRWKFDDPIIIDEGKGSANISVVSEPERDLVFASNVTMGEVALYEIY